MAGSGLGTCIVCGSASAQAQCACGGLVVFEDPQQPWTPDWADGDHEAMDSSTAMRFEGCTVHGPDDRPVDRCTLVVDADGLVLLDRRDEPWLDWSYEQIRAVTVDDLAGVQQRITATRVAFLGLWSLVAQKRTSVGFVSIEVANGTIVVEVPVVAPVALRSRMSHAVPKRLMAVDRPAQSSEPDKRSHADRLRTLDDLLADGLLSKTEHSARRQAILDSI